MVALEMRWMRMPAQRAPSLLPGSETWRRTAIMRSSLSNVALKDTSLTRFTMSRRCVRGAWSFDGIDLHQDRIVRGALPDQRGNGGIARISAIPIGLAVDLDGLKHRRQAGGGEQDLRRQLGVAEMPAPGVHIGCGDEQLDRRLGEVPEVDAVGEDVAQRIGAMRIEVIGREDARHQVEREEHWGGVERPAPEHDVEGCAPKGAEQGSLRDAPPKLFEGRLGAVRAACGVAADEDRRVHGAG